MHIAAALVTIAIFLHKKYYVQLPKYHTTILFVVATDFMYMALTENNHPWEYTSPILSHVAVEALYNFTVIPCLTVMYLAKYPLKPAQQLIYITKWCVGLTIAEYIFLQFGYFKHQLGWNIWYSFLFNIVMFSYIRIHTVKPVRAYILTLCTAFVMLLIIYGWHETMSILTHK